MKFEQAIGIYRIEVLEDGSCDIDLKKGTIVKCTKIRHHKIWSNKLNHSIFQIITPIRYIKGCVFYERQRDISWRLL